MKKMETLYAIEIIPTKKVRSIKTMEYRGNDVWVHPFLYDCLRIIDIKNWEGFFKLAGITFKKVKITPLTRVGN